MRPFKSILIIVVVVILGWFIFHNTSPMALAPTNSTSDTPAPIPANAVVIDSSQNGQTISLLKAQTLVLTLRNLDAGYKFDTPKFDGTILEFKNHSHTNPSIDSVPGNIGTDTWQFQALENGTTALEITTTRPTNLDDTVSLFKATVNVGLPATATTAGSGEHCGGNMANAPSCITGYHCAPNVGSTLPFGDVGGTCVKD